MTKQQAEQEFRKKSVAFTLEHECLTYNEIAQALGITVPTLLKWLGAAKVPRRKRGAGSPAARSRRTA